MQSYSRICLCTITIESMDKRIHPSKLFLFLERTKSLFIWLHLFYPSAKKTAVAYKLFCFVPQKILRINGSCPWPVHFTSRVLQSKNISIGDRSNPGLNSGGYIQAKNGIQIGSNCRFGPNVGLISANHDLSNYDIWIKEDPIVIGDNVWIGMNTVVLPGTNIGDNVVIGANSTVNGAIPSNTIAVGNPCKVIKQKQAYNG